MNERGLGPFYFVKNKIQEKHTLTNGKMQRFIDERNPDQFILYFWNKG
jgi:hypothetical protein